MHPAQHRPPDPAGLLRAAMAGDGPQAPWEAPPIADLAAAFPELTIHGRIGQGGMAAVFHATQTRLARAVALKVMRPDLVSQPQFAERFLREARALATLRNDHVLAIHDFGERAGFCYLVTEFVDGANLRELMQLGRLSPAEVLRLVPQICAGLHFAHAHGVVHRDVKPENVLVDREGRVKLADFGLAKLADGAGPSTFTRSGEVLGTPHYMAPEQWHGSAGVDHRADIYGLGVLLYELLTGRLPVGTYAPASQQPGVPPGIDPIVQRSLQHEPADRYQSAGDVQRDLERQRAAPATSTGRGHAGRWLAAAVAVLLTGTALVGWFLYTELSLAKMSGSLRALDDYHVRLAATISETVNRGEPWTRDVTQSLPPMRERGRLEEGVRTTVAVGVGLATLLATALLAAAARRRTRDPATSRGVHVAAGFVLAAPLVVGVGALLGWYPTLTRYGVTPAPALSLFSTLGVAVVVLWLLWSASSRRRRTPVVTGPVGWPTRIGLGLCALLGLYCALLLAQAPRREGWVPIARLPVPGAELVGRSRLEVLDRLGPPRAIGGSMSGMDWSYRGLDGREYGQALRFVSETVVSAWSHAVLVAEPKPADGLFVGQTLQELIRAYGPPTSKFIGAYEGTMLGFANGASATANEAGIVVHLSKPPR